MLLPLVSEEPAKLTMVDEFSNIVFELYALLCIMVMITVIETILASIKPVWPRPQHSYFRQLLPNLYQNLR